MDTITQIKSAFLGGSIFLMAAFGLTGSVSAASASISDTGPGSVNTIKVNNKIDCEQTNNNNVSFFNDNTQYAVSGDATVGSDGWMLKWAQFSPEDWANNGHSFDDWWQGVHIWVSGETKPWDLAPENIPNNWQPESDNWSQYNPLLWKSHGKSYEQWQGGVNSYLDKNHDGWQGKWLGGNTEAGSATSGDAINTSTANFSVKITNKNHCLVEASQPYNPGTPGHYETSTIPGSSFTSGGGIGGGGFGGGYGGSNFYNNPGGPTTHNTAPQTITTFVPGTPASSPTPQQQSNNYNISNTGPSSTNTISYNNCVNVSQANNNTTSSVNINPQVASSGDATVGSNTSAGGGTSGLAANTSTTTAETGIVN